MRIFILASASLALLAGCEARIGTDKAAGSEEAKGSASASSGGGGDGEAAVQSKEGQISIDAPGFQMKLDIPKEFADRAEIDGNSGIIYPGASLSGMHVEARDQSTTKQSEVELRFTSTDAPAKLFAWYRDPARSGEFTIGSARANGGGYAVTGSKKGDNEPFELSLSPRSDGGTDGLLTLRDSG